MRLETKILVLTLAATLGLSGLAIWVVTARVTAHETERAERLIRQSVDDYFRHLDEQHRRAEQLVPLLVEHPTHRGQLDQVESDDPAARELARAQLRDEIFGREVQTELSRRGPAPAFHVLVNGRGDVLTVSAADDAALAGTLATLPGGWLPDSEPQATSDASAPDGAAGTGELFRRYVWVHGRLFVAMCVPLRLSMSDPTPSHFCFVGYAMDDAMLRGLLGAMHDPSAATSAWFIIDGKPVARATAGGGATARALEAVLIDRLPAPAPSTSPQQLQNLRFSAGGERYIGAMLPCQAVPAGRGVLAVVSSLDEALADLHRLQRDIALATLGVAVVAILACRGLAGMIARPVAQLVNATRRVARGEIGVSVPVRRNDELGQLAASFNEMAAGLEQRDLIKNTFGKFVDPSVVERFLADPARMHLGGERCVHTVLFSDLADFTPLAERLGPEELVKLVNDFLGGAADIVAEQRGVVDKFVGDAVVAFWGPPLTDGHAALACRAALRMSRLTDRFAERCRSLGCPSPRVRVGVATGEVVVGLIGSPNRYSYTVIGDTANLGSRLEALNKLYRTAVLVSGATAAAAGDAVICRRLDRVRIHGRVDPVELYEVMCERDDTPHAVAALRRRERYDAGVALYQARRWTAAQEAFERAAACDDEAPMDYAADLMAARCAVLVLAPPAADWDGVWDIDVKGPSHCISTPATLAPSSSTAPPVGAAEVIA